MMSSFKFVALLLSTSVITYIKKAKSSPNSEKDDPTDATNYRPRSITSEFTKVFVQNLSTNNESRTKI